MEKVIEFSGEQLRTLFGQNDKYLEKIENKLNVILVNRNGVLKIIGEEPNVESAYSMMTACLKTGKGGDDLEEQKIDYAISLAKEKQEEALSLIDK